MICLLSGIAFTADSIVQLVGVVSELVIDNQLVLAITTALDGAGVCDLTANSACAPMCALIDDRDHECRNDATCRDALQRVCGK